MDNAALLADGDLPQRLKTRVLLVVAVGYFAFTALGTVVIPILPDALTVKLGLPSLVVFPLFAAAPAVQLVTGPWLGGSVDRIGPWRPMMVALCVLAAASALFGGALYFVPMTADHGPGPWIIYTVLFCSRACQGLCSAALLSAGMSLVATTHSDGERGSATGLAMSGLALGALTPLFGGFVAQAAGLGVPFFILVGVILVDLAAVMYLRGQLEALGLNTTGSEKETNSDEPPSLPELGRPFWRERSVIVISGAIICANVMSSLTEPLAPIWLGNGPLGYGPGLQGLIFGAATIAYFVATPITGMLADDPARRVPLLVGGLVICALGLISLGLAPLMATFAEDQRGKAVRALPLLMLGLSLEGVGLACIDTPALPLLSAIEEARGGTHFGSAAAVQTTAFAIGQTLGPALSLPLVAAFSGADSPAWLADGIAPASWPAAFACLCMIPALICWVRLPTLNERAPELMATSPLSINSINADLRTP